MTHEFKLAVLAFPGNNCETETVRAARRNGFQSEIVRWNELGKIGNYDTYILCGGFSFEDRGRSGVIASREPIFDALREEAKKGKLILGVCNGAQMIVESGLIPVEGRPLPFGLAANVRRDETGKVLGTGYFNTWVHIRPQRTDTAFVNSEMKVLHLPIAHGEGRFTSTCPEGLEALKSGSHVAFRYCDTQGKPSEKFPITPNGSLHATAGIVNKEGTIMALMPHPERFFDSFDGDQILTAMHQWLVNGRSPNSVQIGDLASLSIPEVADFSAPADSILIEKRLLITDNEAFSVSQAAGNIAGNPMEILKSTLYVISGSRLTKEKILATGLVMNENKELLVTESSKQKYGVELLEDDAAASLGQKLSAELGTECKVQRLVCWDFGETDAKSMQKVLSNGLLANPNAARLFKLT